MKHFFLACIVCLAAANATASDSCSQMEAYAAETVTDYLDSWENVYQFFKQFRNCYDASIAEGAADRIQILWSDHWSTLPKLIAIAAKDAEFKAFIWRRIDDEIWPADRFALVLRNAKTKCPQTSIEFCRAVIKSSVRNKVL